MERDTAVFNEIRQLRAGDAPDRTKKSCQLLAVSVIEYKLRSEYRRPWLLPVV